MVGGTLFPWLAQPLADALSQQRGHALLVHGPRGVGQFQFAMGLARAWLCEAPQSERPAGLACGQCGSCRLVDTQAHHDLRVVVPEAMRELLGLSEDDEEPRDEEGKKRKPSREIKVDQIRAAIDFAELTSARGRLKVVVIHPAEQVNPIAANALLKTLEEPQGSLRFVLSCGAPHLLLPTIRSRCQSVRLTLPPAELAAPWLAEQGVAEPKVALAACGGQPLSVVELAAQGIDAAAWKQLPRRVLEGDATAFAEWPLPLVIDALQKLAHDQLLVSAGAAPRFFPAAAVPGPASRSDVLAWTRELQCAARHAEHPLNAGLAVEVLVQKARLAGQPTPDPQGRGGRTRLHSAA